MATKRPAKIATKKKKTVDKYCPITGKPMTPVRMIRGGGSGMYWMVVEDFDGSDKALDRLIPTR